MGNNPGIDQQLQDMLAAMRAVGSDGEPVFQFNEIDRGDIYTALIEHQETYTDVDAGARALIDKFGKE